MSAVNVESILAVLGRVSLQAGVLVLLVLGVQWLFRRQLTPRWRCVLWAVVLVRLILPFAPGSAASVFNLVPRWSERSTRTVRGIASPPATAGVPTTTDVAPVSRTGSRPKTAIRSDSEPRVEPAAQTAPTIQEVPAISSRAEPAVTASPKTVVISRARIPILQILFWIWLAGAASLGGWIVVCSGRLSRGCRGLPAFDAPAVLAVRDDCARRLGLRTELMIVESSAVESPALFGLFRPRLLLPAGFIGQFTEQELRFVMLHEMAHLKRRDLWINWLATMLQVMHWFNPLLWLGFLRWRSDRELACDALALEAAGADQNQEYGRTILHLLERFTHRTPSPGLVGILEDRRQLRQRIGMIARFRPGQRWGFLSAALLVLLAVIGLTDAQTPRPAQPVKAPVVASVPPEKPEEFVGADPLPEAAGTNVEARTMVVTVLDVDGKPLPGAEVQAPYVRDRRGRAPKRRTDGAGRYTVRYVPLPKELRRQASNFGINARHTNFASRAVMWTSSGGDVYASLPGEVTLKLEQGISVGGVVKDERGQPLDGIRVLLSGSDYRGFSMGTTERKMHEYAELRMTDPKSPAAVTDKSGRWSFAHFPSELDRLELTLIRPDDARESFAAGPEDGLNQRIAVSLAELKAGTAVTTMREGVTVRGAVVDEKGKPLAAVTVREGYGHGNIVRISEFTTDAQGRFERPHRAPRQWIYTASRTNRATASVVVQVEQNTPEVRIVLAPAQPWRARVADAQGNPVTDAEFTLDSYRTEGQIHDWTGRADAEGRVVWTNAPPTNVTLYVGSASLGVSRKIKTVPGEPERLVVLNNTAADRIQIRMKARDAATGQAVNVRSAAARLEGAGTPFKELNAPNAPEFTLTIRRKDFSVGMYPSYHLKVEADGFEAWTSESIDYDLGDQELNVALHPAIGVAEITVLQPDGKPAAGARLWARSSRDDGYVFINSPGRYYGDRLAKAQADDTGRLRLPAAPADAPVILAHPDGFLETTMAEVRRGGEVRLARYGTVEGRLLIAGEPARGVTINLSTLAMSPSLAYHLAYTTTTGPDGRFAFQQVPAGQFKLYRWALPKRRDTSGQTITETYQLPVTVVAGETHTIEYYSPGRAVVGQVTPIPVDAAVDWFNDVHTLTLKLAPIAAGGRRVNREDYASFAAFLEANNASFGTRSQLEQARFVRTYPLALETDGSFRIEDVPAGTYELRIRVTKPDESKRRNPFGQGDELGSFVREVIVPEGREALELGTLQVPVKEVTRSQRVPPVAFHAMTLDGQPLTLAQFKGTNVLLIFWAAWSDRSMEQLAALEKLRIQMASESRLVFVGVNVDESAAAAGPALKTSGWQGRQCWLDASARAKIADTFDINFLPAVYLLDTEGRIVGRDLDAERLATALKRALARR